MRPPRNPGRFTSRTLSASTPCYPSARSPLGRSLLQFLLSNIFTPLPCCGSLKATTSRMQVWRAACPSPQAVRSEACQSFRGAVETMMPVHPLASLIAAGGSRLRLQGCSLLDPLLASSKAAADSKPHRRGLSSPCRRRDTPARTQDADGPRSKTQTLGSQSC